MQFVEFCRQNPRSKNLNKARRLKYFSNSSSPALKAHLLKVEHFKIIHSAPVDFPFSNEAHESFDIVPNRGRLGRVRSHVVKQHQLTQKYNPNPCHF